MNLMTILAILSSVFIFLGCFSLAFLMFKKSGGRKSTMIWGYFCFTISMWGLGAAIATSSSSKEVGYMGWQIANIGSILTSPLFFHFGNVYLGYKNKYSILAMYVLAVF